MNLHNSERGLIWRHTRFHISHVRRKRHSKRHKKPAQAEERTVESLTPAVRRREGPRRATLYLPPPPIMTPFLLNPLKLHMDAESTWNLSSFPDHLTNLSAQALGAQFFFREKVGEQRDKKHELVLDSRSWEQNCMSLRTARGFPEFGKVWCCKKWDGS